MIRFVDLNDQIVEGVHEFAFYDTVTDTFVDFDGSQTFDSIKSFESYCPKEKQERFLKLISQKYK